MRFHRCCSWCVYASLLYNDFCPVVTVLITVKVPQLQDSHQSIDQVFDVPVAQVQQFLGCRQ